MISYIASFIWMVAMLKCKIEQKLSSKFFAVVAIIVVSGCATQPELQGHRGARGLLPENTLPAFEAALKIGVDVLELDAGITKDGVVVIGHDPCLNVDLARDKSGVYIQSQTKFGPCITNMTLVEVQEFDVGRIRPGSDYAKRFPNQQPVDGTPMPTLAALFDMVKKQNNDRVRFNIETKISPFERTQTISPEAFVNALLGAIAKEKMLHRVTIESFDWRTLKLVQRDYPNVPTVYLSAQQKFFDNIRADDRAGSAWTAGLNAQDFAGSVAKMVKAAGGKIWSPYFGDVDEAKIKHAQALGLKVVVWTVNEAKDISRMLGYGVDGIISDYPDRAAEIMRKRNLR
jgi:glycerophosphoryl diester phosphodiesterase